MINTKDAARAWASGAIKALPRVVGAEKPSIMLSTRVMASLIRAAFVAGAIWQATQYAERANNRTS